MPCPSGLSAEPLIQDVPYEQRAVQNQEFDWNTAASATSFRQLSFDALMTIVKVYHAPLKALFTMEPRRLFEHFDQHIGEKWKQCIRKIMKQLKLFVESTSELQLHLPQTQYSVAVLKWTLGLSSFVADTRLPVTVKDIECLIELKVPFGISKGEERLLNALPLLVSLDGPASFIYNQAELRHFLLTGSMKIANVILHRTEGTEPKIGAALIDFLLHPQIVDQVWDRNDSGQHLFFDHAFNRCIIRVMTLTDARASRGEQIDISNEAALKRLFLQEMPSEDAEITVSNVFSRFTAKAWALLILRAITSMSVRTRAMHLS
jgi:hypothetical protein